MGHYACIAIGINHYQFLAPLNYGQADAYKLRQFLVNQANLPSEQFLLLSDTSPLVDNFSTYPTQENIWRHLEAPESSWHSAQYRWFFFSGYGVSLDGIDYLMPIDGNPHDIPGTAMPMRSLLTSLKDSGCENLLVLLDINRSPGLQTGKAMGAETVALAHELNIALIFSGQLDQFSHEAAALGNGLFTTAILEALRYYDTEITLENLDEYLRSYLPQLSQHHLRPIQNPLTIVPFEEARQQLILPTAKDESDFLPSINEANFNHARFEESNHSATMPNQKAAIVLSEERPKPPKQTFPQNAPVLVSHEKPIFEISLGRQVLLLGGGAVLVIFLTIAAILLNERQIFIGNKTATTIPKTNTIASPATGKLAVASSRLKANLADLEQAKSILRPNQASLFNQAITKARQVQPGDPLYQQARQDMARWSAVILDLAQGRAAQQNFSEAIATAQLVPDDDPTIYKTTQKTIASWKLMAQQYQQNQAIIQEAKNQLQSNQASSYRRAIIILSKIPPDQAGYAQAQQLIEQWSRTIYLIAQSRASQGKFENAIATVALVPSGTSSSEAAQKAIVKWKQAQR